MKKLLTILTFLIVTLNCFSQNVQSNNSFIFQPTTNSTTSIWFKNGIGKIDSGWRVPIDNRIWTPTGSGWIRFNPTIGALQYYNADSLKWLLVGSGSGGLPPSLATLSPGFGLIGVTYDPYLTSQTWLVDTSKLLTINNFLTNYFDTSSSTTATFFNVVSINNTPPVSPLDSSYYLVGTAPTGIWITHENQVAQRLGTGWAYTTPEISQTLTDISTQTIYIWNGTAWIPQKFAILGQLNPQDVDLRVGSIPNKALNFYTDSTLRMGIAADGGISFPAFNDLSTDYTVQLVLKNNLLDTVHARDLILTTNGSSGAATLINNVLNIPQYSSGGGGGVQSVTGNITGLVNNTDPLNPIVNAWRFGIEDNLGLQDRNVDMQGFGLYTYNGKEWNFSADAGIKTSYIIGKVSSTLPIMELSVKDSAGDQTINQNIIYPDSTIQYIHNIAGKDIRVTTPTPANGFYYSPLTVNGNKADSTGNITISTGTGGISQLGSPTYGLTRTNDSTYIVDTAVIASQIRLHNDSLTLATAINLKVNISDTAAMLSHYLNNVGYGLSKSGQVVSADTLALSTRAWRQKGIDSVVSLIPSLTGYVNAIAGENYLSKSGSTITANPVNLANTNVTGVLPIANGGTNNGSLSVTNGNLLYTDGSKVVALGVGTAKQHLVGGTIPSWKDTATGGGGSGITKAYLPLVVSSGGDSISQRFNVKAYGAVGDGVTNDGPSIRAAIAACDAAGGGIVFFPNTSAYYNVTDTIITASNSVFNIPSHSNASRTSITLEGETAPSAGLVGGGLPGANTTIGKGTRIHSTLTSGAAGAAIFGTTATNLTTFIVKDLILSVKNNAGTGPVLGGINWKNGGNIFIDNINVTIDTSVLNSSLPSVDVSGIELPNSAATENYVVSNSLIVGFRTGIYLSEHTSLLNNTIYGCWNGIKTKTGGHASYATRIGIYWCKNDIYADGTGVLTLKIDELADEYATTAYVGAKWYVNAYTLCDSLNSINGIIFYKSDSTGQVSYYSHFTKNGGTKVNAYAIYDSTSFLKLNSATNVIADNSVAGSPNTTLTIDGKNKWAGVNLFGLTGKWELLANRFGAAEFSIFDSVLAKARMTFQPNGDVYAGGTTTATGTTIMQLTNSTGAAQFNFDVLWGGATSALKATTGRIGIGTTSPSDPLYILGATSSNWQAVIENTNASGQSNYRIKNSAAKLAQMGIYGASASAYGSIVSGSAYLYGTGTALTIMQDASGPINFCTGTAAPAALRASIDASGNFILNTAPATNAEASPALLIRNASTGNIEKRQISFGQTTLVSGTKAVAVTGVGTGSIATVTIVSVGGTVTTTWQYKAVCTSNTITITAIDNTGATNTLDTSVLNYTVVF